MGKNRHKADAVIDDLPGAPAAVVAEAPVDTPDIHPNAAEIALIDAEIAAIGDPRARLEANAAALAEARKARGRAIADADKLVGDLMNAHRVLQKDASNQQDKLARLQQKRDRLMGPDGGE